MLWLYYLSKNQTRVWDVVFLQARLRLTRLRRRRWTWVLNLCVSGGWGWDEVRPIWVVFNIWALGRWADPSDVAVAEQTISAQMLILGVEYIVWSSVCVCVLTFARRFAPRTFSSRLPRSCGATRPHTGHTQAEDAGIQIGPWTWQRVLSTHTLAILMALTHSNSACSSSQHRNLM